ncbi:MAG: glycoside hydrolase family 31 protein [Clostridia bacterium]
MLVRLYKKTNAITSTQKTGNSLVLKAERGLLRLKPQSENIVRVTYTEKEDFSSLVGIGICNEQDFADWTYEENDEVVILKLAKLTVCVNKASGSIKYYDVDGDLILAERDFESHEVQEYDAMRTIVDEHTKIEEIETPDGTKRVIKEATEVFDKKLYHTKLHFNFKDDEKIFGLGQAEEGSLNLRGTTQYVHQANLKIAIPVLLSTAGYGIIFSTGSPAIFNDTAYGSYFYTESDLEMDFYFVAASKFDNVVKAYRFLTGKAVMLPRWAFGFMQSQERYETQQEVLEIVKGYKDREIGIDCIIMDWMSWEGQQWGQKTFDFSRFPDPKLMTDTLHEQNVNFMLSIWPNMRELGDNYEEFLDAKLLLPANVIYDAFKKEARDMYWRQTNEGLFKYGIDAWWCDSSEPFCPEWNGSLKAEASKMYENYVKVASKYVADETMNAYGIRHAQTISDGQISTGTNKRVCNLTRNSYTGGQKYGVILWSGDTGATWDTYRNQIVAGLNFCATGLPYWTLDIGAFFVGNGEKWFWNGSYNDGFDDLAYKELFVRWFQYGGFLPIFRSHGTDIRREMWFVDGENHMFYDALVKANKLRYTLIPYIYAIAGSVYLNDCSMMKMLAFDFPKDDKATSIKNQYMFGDIMVCPVTDPMYYTVNSTELTGTAKTREVYLPQGADWYDFYTNEKYTGGQTICAKADISTIPLYVKAGSIIPMTDVLQSTVEVETAKITVHVYTGADAEFDLYEDSGNGYEYQNGDYFITKFIWKDELKTLSISKDSDRFNVEIHEV